MKDFPRAGSLWVQTVRSKYKVSNPYKLRDSGGNFSWVWRGILKVLPMLKERLCLLPRNGANVNLREDPWLPSGQNFCPAWRNGRFEAAEVQMVSDLLVNGQWDFGLILQ